MISIASVLGLIACLFTIMMVGSQFIKTVHTGKTRDLSLASLIFAVVEVSLWMSYALMTNDVPLKFAGFLSLIMYATMLVSKISNILRGEDK